MALLSSEEQWRDLQHGSSTCRLIVEGAFQTCFDAFELDVRPKSHPTHGLPLLIPHGESRIDIMTLCDALEDAG